MPNTAQLTSRRIEILIRSGCWAPEPTPKLAVAALRTSLCSVHSGFQGVAETADCPLIPLLNLFLSDRTPQMLAGHVATENKDTFPHLSVVTWSHMTKYWLSGYKLKQ